MIVARVYPPSKEFVPGSCELPNWFWTEGWYPISGFGYGIEGEETETESSPGKSPGGPPGASRGAPGGGPRQSQGNNQKESSDKKSPKMTFEKNIDYSTVYSMKQVMEHRKARKGVDDKVKLHADIHVLSSVEIKRGGSVEKCAYASLMIHLQGVVLKAWKISGHGDDRPTENIELSYDRACMTYNYTADGKTFYTGGSKGWDETKNCEWVDDSKFESRWKPPLG